MLAVRVEHRCAEILNALIQKGLRPQSASQSRMRWEILNALIQKGLRLHAVAVRVVLAKY